MILNIPLSRWLQTLQCFSKRYLSCKIQNKLKDPTYIYSTLFQHNKNYYPNVVANLENIDLKKVKTTLELRNLNFDLDKIRSLRLIYEELKSESLPLIAEKEKLLNDFKEGSINNVEQARDVRTKLKYLNNRISDIMDELTLNLLRLPNENQHLPNEYWNGFITENREFKNSLNTVLDVESVNEQIDIFLADTKMSYSHSVLSMHKFVMMEHSYDWWLSKGFIAIALSDICKTAVVEACNNEVGDGLLALTNSKMNNDTSEVNPHNIVFLPGSASLESFCGYFLRTKTANKSLPARLVTLGNKYNSKSGEVRHDSVISVLVATQDTHAMENELANLLHQLRQYWTDNFDISVCGASVPYPHLDKCESHRYVLQCADEEKTILAYVSVIGDYISRRIMIHGINDAPLHLIYAEVCNFNSLCTFVRRTHKKVVFSYNSDWL